MSLNAKATHPALLKILPKNVRTEHKSVRVTSQAKMTQLISFALTSFRDAPTTPIVFHCFPPPPSPASSSPSTSTQLDPSAPPPAPQPTASKLKSKPMSKATETIPKLVSVVEVIKREYNTLLSSLPSTAVDKGKGKAVEGEDDEASKMSDRGEGLHQYALLTTFEELGVDGAINEGHELTEEEEAERNEGIVLDWLSGNGGKRKRPRMKHTPCMIVVLTTKVNSNLENLDFSYQAPLKLPKPKKPSDGTAGGVEAEGDASEQPQKKKRRRQRKHGKKPTGEAGGGGEGDMNVDVAEAAGATE